MYASGLWLLWNSDRVDVSLLAKMEQETHAVVKVRPFNINCSTSNLIDMPWVIAGDFNKPLLDSDKYEGRAININNSLLFKECLDRCNMIDLGFSGPRFTWTNKSDISSLIQERIDRFFVNLDWWHLLPESKITHLTRCHSDHCFVLLETSPVSHLQLKRPFKFQRFWLSNPSFLRIVATVWRNSDSLEDAVHTFEREATIWNNEHFGNIFAKKKKIMAQLNGV